MSDTPAPSAPTAPQPAEEVAAAAGDAATSDVSTPGCPICEFIEAGPCGGQHKVWVSCRGEAKEQGEDFVQSCADTFRSFFACMLSHQDYYQPFLDAFHVDTDLSQQAIDAANARKEQQQPQQEQEGQPQQPPSGQQQQQQQSQPAASQQPQPAPSSQPAAGGASSSQQGHTPAAVS